MNSTLGYSYYTPITTKNEYNDFMNYMNHMSSQKLTENIANKMTTIEQLILNSAAYKSQGIKQPHHNKWQVHKLANKTSLTELCLILNRINSSNTDELIGEATKYDRLSYNDIKQITDILLGKCIKEPNNIETYCHFLKCAISNSLWYVYHDNNVISFLDICLDQLENNFKDLTKMAGFIEDMYESQKIKEEVINGIIISQMHNSEQFMKRKNIIIGVIQIIGSFYNNQIISNKLLENIFDDLKYRYNDMSEHKHKIKIYFELWLSLFNKVKNNLPDDDFHNKCEWLVQMKDDIGCDRLNILIENSLNEDNIKNNIVIVSDLIDEIKNLIALLHTDDDFKEFATKYGKEVNKYITKYILEQSNIDLEILNTTIHKLTTYVISKKDLNKIVNDLLNDEEFICDYPNFIKYFSEFKLE